MSLANKLPCILVCLHSQASYVHSINNYVYNRSFIYLFIHLFIFHFRTWAALVASELVRSLLMKYRKEKGWLMTYYTLLPHMPTVFITSHAQNAGHKMAALTAHAFVTFKFWFLRNLTIIRLKTTRRPFCCVVNFISIYLFLKKKWIPFLSIEPVVLRSGSLLRYVFSDYCCVT